MGNNKKLKYSIIGIALIVIAIIIVIMSILLKKEENSVVAQKDIDVEVEYDEDDENISWKNQQYTDIVLSDESVDITKAGIYHITGTLNNGNITINAGKTDVVRLILDGVNITSSDYSAIYVENAEKVIITVEEGTENTLIDGDTYSTQDEPDGAVFSKDDLVINGTGTLNVTANYLDGIVSKDTLKIIGTTINVTANDDGIRGKDYIAIKEANINIKANSDGLKATNDTDTTLGYILIESGNIEIDAQQDAIQAETNVKIQNGTINIKTGGGSTNSSSNENWGQWGMKTNINQNINTSQTTTEISAKAIKGNTGILIEGGTINIDSSDDSIHSNGTIIINGGTINLSSGDDGIHADESVYINNGDIKISKSYEGIEGSLIEMNGGNISLNASDDGINIAGGNDNSSMNGRPGQNNFNTSNSDQKLIINNGYILIDATGDGIDVNGAAYINGGTVIVNGPTNDGNGALDYDGAFEVAGGELIALGSSGMMQTPSNNSSIYSISYIYDSTQQPNNTVTLKNENGEEIISVTPTKNYNSIIISSSKLEKGGTYTLYSNNEKIDEITVNSIVTTSGNSGFGMQNGGMNNGQMQGGATPGRSR